ncbi:MAG: hypothetical protein Q9183_002528 [Haloplaca sp. 2 TL-2023]
MGRLIAFTETAGLYPLKASNNLLPRKTHAYIEQGLIYFARHPFLYPLLRARLVPALLLSVVVLATLFIWTYLPQVAFLALFHGRHLAWINGAFLVLGEGAAVTALLFEAFFVDESLVDVFDATLIEQGCQDLVSTSRPLNPEASDPVKQLGKPMGSAVYSPFSLRQIIEFILFLPLNFIPIAGTPLFIIVTGYRAGPLHHWRYFKFLGFNKKERNRHIQQRKLQYTSFGIVALLLQLVPVLSMLFLLTTAAGSALWVAKLEQKRRLVRGSDDDPGQYEDDPP